MLMQPDVTGSGVEAGGSADVPLSAFGVGAVPMVAPEAGPLKFQFSPEHPDQLFRRAVASALSTVSFHRSLT